MNNLKLLQFPLITTQIASEVICVSQFKLILRVEQLVEEEKQIHWKQWKNHNWLIVVIVDKYS